jgi:hypothetical protein
MDTSGSCEALGENNMENTLWTALGASVFAALITAIGIYTIRHIEAWDRKYSMRFGMFMTPAVHPPSMADPVRQVRISIPYPSKLTEHRRMEYQLPGGYITHLTAMSGEGY